MAAGELNLQQGAWLRGGGPLHDVVVSSRVRLARNLAGMPFLSRCSPAQQRELEQRLRQEVLSAELAPEMFYVDVESAGELDRLLLVERHLISRQHADAGHPRGVAIAKDETVAVMINEEDHLRIQVLRSGLQLEDACEAINQLDDRLEERLSFAFHRRWGYLTACPTNVGTGLRVSVMLHLPAVKMTGEIERVFRAARDMRLAIRGLFGEGTEATGDFFQVSNQTTLGKTEDQIIRKFRDDIIPHFIEYERRARRYVAEHQSVTVDDRIYRADAILRAARRVSCDEALHYLSLVRMGVDLDKLTNTNLRTVNELCLLSQPAHLQRIAGRPMETTERDEARADYIRHRLAGRG